MPKPRSGPTLPIQRYLFSPVARRVWAALLCLLALLTVYAALSPKPPDQLNLGWDKANHATSFAMLAAVGVFALQGVAHAGLRLSAGLFVLGAAIEVAQTMVPGRRGDALDLLADTLGIVLGLLIGTVVARHFERRRQPRGPAPDALPSGH
ncbi:MAG TPA: VanZ family protein [Rubrivivax sp.]